VYIGLIAALALVMIGAIYLGFFYLPECQNYECFQKYMIKCSKATYINEEPEASWGYRINGARNGDCEITVTLLQAKQGELRINALAGEEMKCYYTKGTSAYPEKDLVKCHGILKEDMQTLIINKLHAYILENLGKFEESLSKL
jgi:hypothetical protein